MSLLPLDIQANYGNFEIGAKEISKVQNLAEQISYNSAVTIEKFSKEIYEKIIETNETAEQEKIHSGKRKDKEEKKKKRKNNVFFDMQSMTPDDLKKKLISTVPDYKGNFVNLYD